MQLNKLSAMAMTLGVLSSTSVMADSGGTITFVGEVLATTCNVTLDSSSSANGTVSLPSALLSDLDIDGKFAGETSFTLNLTGCVQPSHRSAPPIPFAYFSGGNSANRLDNTKKSDGATNVEIELLDSAKNTIKIDDVNQQRTQAITGTGKLQYYARYRATGKATAGGVSSMVSYNIQYK
ncbi:fimbrial protein [Xenorhabdus szentirmaii]|uniref:F17 fimbrial protein n=1 Tax=Xenorhabdus szentirmaii DSM 16338 TaxID=1427518 RepID=W1J3H7_9GAMM|nr:MULTISPECIES: fimbrial protein [Xenorhabdus]MBD2780872.1 type 1 fimbrial protein [Xenorhabdus sp. 38]PHM31884.1 F17 fimbrial major subunit protein [Xenorhabdus szentirmaii DSM 16338]CDL85279.1 putative F17 fimbrial protein [Xenorhabdus szentirmaii DSM 16338]